MMKWNGYRRAIISLFAGVCVLWSGYSQVAHANGQVKTDYVLSKIKYTNNGGRTVLKTNKNDELEVSISTKALKEGYYTSVLYMAGKSDLRQGEVIVVGLSAKKELAMNLNLIDKHGKALAFRDGEQILLRRKGSTKYQVTTVENGTFPVPKDFSGDILLPVDRVARGAELLRVNQLAFIFVEPEAVETQCTIERVQLLKKESTLAKYLQKNYQVRGAAQTKIPSNGEYEYEYAIYSGEVPLKGCKITIETEGEGVHLTEEGVVVVSDSAKEQEMSIVFTLPDSSQIGYPVSILEPWYRNHPELEVAYAVPTVEEAAMYNHAAKSESMAEALEFALRILLVAGMVSYLVFYSRRIWRR